MNEGAGIPEGAIEDFQKTTSENLSQKKQEGEGVKDDPRNYFAVGKFQIEAEAIDPNRNHPWNMVRYGGVLIKDDFGAIAVGETYDADLAQTSKKTPFGLLIAERGSDGKASSVLIRDLDMRRRHYVIDAINTIAPSLPDGIRHQFIRKVIEGAEALKDENVVAEKLARIGLELLPDHKNAFQPKQPFQWPEVDGKVPTEEQQEQLIAFIRLVASKMPRDKFKKHMQKFLDELPFTDDPYGKNYQRIFLQMTRWVLEEREDTQREFGILQKVKPDEYSIKDKVRKPINTKEELEEALASLPVEEMPDTENLRRSNEAPEMVELDKIVGGSGIETWAVISTSEGRGTLRILELVQALQDGSASVTDPPIRLIEIGGKYYVESDGRHRVAALKALGVDKIPAMVAHLRKP